MGAHGLEGLHPRPRGRGDGRGRLQTRRRLRSLSKPDTADKGGGSGKGFLGEKLLGNAGGKCQENSSRVLPTRTPRRHRGGGGMSRASSRHGSGGRAPGAPGRAPALPPPPPLEAQGRQLRLAPSDKGERLQAAPSPQAPPGLNWVTPGKTEPQTMPSLRGGDGRASA